jgi:hypothetical protein
MPHRERQRWVEQIAHINREINAAAAEGLQ